MLQNQWGLLGLHLNIDHETIRNAEKYTQDEDSMKYMFSQWLNRSPIASWSEIIRVVQKLNYHKLAAEINTKYFSRGISTEIPTHGMLI